MTEELKVTIERRGNGAILYTRGYINNVGGEEIANRAYELIDGSDTRTLLLNLRETKIVNSIGISILIEIIEKMNEKGGRLAFCCLTPVIQKTFQIMGLAQYAPIFPDEETAVGSLGLTRSE
ncbi:MAG: STAS domain-containing protein [Thermoanaerobaculia bacterium]